LTIISARHAAATCQWQLGDTLVKRCNAAALQEGSRAGKSRQRLPCTLAIWQQQQQFRNPAVKQWRKTITSALAVH
jgi:hypothetical protein